MWLGFTLRFKGSNLDRNVDKDACVNKCDFFRPSMFGTNFVQVLIGIEQ